MIKRDVASLMIFEDDADWDVALKSQLVQFARGSRYLTNTPSSDDTIPNSPYGNDWDILWLGHAAADDKSPYIQGDVDNRRFVIPKDPTVLPPENRTESPGPDMSYWEDGPDGDTSTRIVLMPTWSLNTAGYAVSQRGARKLLYLMSLVPFDDPVDQAMGYYCKFKIMNMKCIAPFPALVGVSKPAGGIERWSDMDHIEDGEKQKEFLDDSQGFSLRVRFSVRQNLDRLLDGQQVFRDADGMEMHIDDIAAAVGHSEVVQLHGKTDAKEQDVGPPDTQVMRVVDFTPKNQNA
jgi:GR25 family glycosyltransferase involved in LPS biosynthesis